MFLLIKNKTFASLGFILAFNLMLINYFGDFSEGSVNTDGGIKIIIKIISILFIYLLGIMKEFPGQESGQH